MHNKNGVQIGVDLADYTECDVARMKSFFRTSDVDCAEFDRLCKQKTDPGTYRHAVDVIDNVVVYDREAFVESTGSALKSELAHCLQDGPGVFAVRGAYDDLSVIDRCTAVFARIVAREAVAGASRGDHFGTNERIWNSLQKTCIADPTLFVQYYGNPVLRIASEAWLGPSYRITAQMNNIKPGGAAQSAHRDYHLGFQSSDTIAEFPVHAQQMSQFLTLQGAIAHCDMPVETGPTLLLPFSQQYQLGYMASGQREFEDYFADHHVQLPWAKGDALFFNPALFHAGGSNASKADRVANLIQVSSAFGRTMESIDHRVMIEAVYPVLLNLSDPGQIDNVINVIADGYSFPTNLDLDSPKDGNAPITQQQLVHQALAQSMTVESLCEQLDQYDVRRRG
jgi:ectoine hydroxylase-related dioxygenase (phytanoyl-CoA dioxygenase family)